MEETYIDRMKTEKAELEQRITKLLAFMGSDKFAELDAIEKRLLRMQYSRIETYRTALAFRLLCVDMKRYEGDIKALKAAGWTDKEIGDMMPQMKIDVNKAYSSPLFNSLIAANSEPAAANDN